MISRSTEERWRAALTYISEHGDRPADQLALEALFALEGKMEQVTPTGRVDRNNQEQELTKRLRGENWWLNVTGDEAADEIERLERHIKDLRELREFDRAEIERLRQDNAEMRELDTLVEGRALEPKP